MGFLLRSAFWLGLAFNAMPWGEARWSDAVPDARDALAASVATQVHDGETASAIARALVRTALEPRPASAGKAAARAEPLAKTRRASVDTLSSADRLAPWRGPGAHAAP
ncbi:MAG: hypothetical protein ABR878_11915 [Roseiarcus sp.]|jgi:hypothetical protein